MCVVTLGILMGTSNRQPHDPEDPLSHAHHVSPDEVRHDDFSFFYPSSLSVDGCSHTFAPRVIAVNLFQLVC
jgi:hypothetical protein